MSGHQKVPEGAIGQGVVWCCNHCQMMTWGSETAPESCVLCWWRDKAFLPELLPAPPTTLEPPALAMPGPSALQVEVVLRHLVELYKAIPNEFGPVRDAGVAAVGRLLLQVELHQTGDDPDQEVTR